MPFGVLGVNSYSKEGLKIYGVSVINRGESFLNLGDGWKDLVDEMERLEIYDPGLAMDNFSIKVFSADYHSEDDHPEYTAVLFGIIAIGAIVLLLVRKH